MARARSDEKRRALLDSAIREIAETGLGASTARIAKGAGLAEGTLFTYFPTKEDLFNELYLALKTDVFSRIQTAFPHEAGLRERARHIWTEYLRWAMKLPQNRKVSVLLHLSPIISASTQHQIEAQRGAVFQTMTELSKQGAFSSLPPGFAISAMSAMQEAVMEVAARKPSQQALLVEQAFEAFWRMAT
jgi:AcrR family transcriptional regulator